MGPTALLALAVAALAVLAAIGLALVLARHRRTAAAELAEARAESRRLAERLDRLEERAERGVVARPAEHDRADYVITRAGEPEAPQTTPLRGDVVIGAAVGESLIKASALAHGLRRALAPRTRNRIRFEVRQELKRSRKQRRQETREAVRRLRAERAAEDAVREGAA